MKKNIDNRIKKITIIACTLLIAASFSFAAVVQRQTTVDNYANFNNNGVDTGVRWMPSIHSTTYGKISDDIHILEWKGPHGSYKDYINSRTNEPFSIQKVTESLNKMDKPTVIVFVDANLMPHIEDEIDVYSSTLVAVGYNSVTIEVSGGTVEDLKNQIIDYWDNGYNLSGAVLIGDFPTAWYHHFEEFPCDLFLMDLDGEWIDSNSDGVYDSHIDGPGDTAPEIYIGRIDASNIPGDEISIIKNYLYKVHDFWMGNISHTDFALTYTDRDWSSWDDIKHDIGYVYEDYEAISYPDVNRDDYVNNRLPDSYVFIQLACHSWSNGHDFDNGGYAYSDDIRYAPPMALFYNLFCCGALRFTDYNCLGNAYILDTDSPSLVVVGSTKSGAMLDFRCFYEPFGQGYSFGQAFQKWFEYEYPYNDDDISWFYGMTILGDPTLILHRAYAHGPYYALIDEPIHFSGSATGGIPPYTWYWDFGDGNNSTLQNPTHTYIEAGNYTVTLTVTDDEQNTDTDTTYAWTQSSNTPPNKPTIDGPTGGNAGEEYDYTFSAVDPDGSVIYLYIEWGDNTFEEWIGPYNSDQQVTVSHAWNEQGTYTIRCKAKDPYDAEGPWGTLDIEMPVNQPSANQQLLETIFQRSLSFKQNIFRSPMTR